jgi:hypothetical protein
VFITFFAEPRAPFEIPHMKNKLLKAYQLDGKRPLELTTKDGKTTFTLSRPMWDSMATVVVVEFEGDRIVR